jgi:hypothetical protein
LLKNNSCQTIEAGIEKWPVEIWGRRWRSLDIREVGIVSRIKFAVKANSSLTKKNSCLRVFVNDPQVSDDHLNVRRYRLAQKSPPVNRVDLTLPMALPL